MLSVFIILGSILILYFIGYRIYGNVLDKNLINPDDSNSTPAHTLKDDVDFYPAQEIILFGHHFSSIAGAGPIIGPIQ